MAMENERTGIYKERIEKFTREQAVIRKELWRISVARLILFLMAAWFVYSAFRDRFEGYELLYAICTIPVFVVLVLFSGRKKEEFKFLQQLIFINQNELDIREGRESFLNNGESYVSAKGFTVDLGLFGKHSLFQQLNRTGSLPGKEQLAKHLSHPFLDPVDITSYQGAVKELATQLAFRQELLARALLLEEEEALPQLKAGIPLETFSVIEKGVWSFLAKVWPVAGIAVTLYSVWEDNYRFMLLFGVLGLLILSFVFRRVNKLYNHISKRSYLYNQYAQCFAMIGNATFQDPLLVKKQQQINEAAGAFKHLSKLTGLFDLRMSLFSFVLNGLFLLDLLCSRAYLKWNRQYQSQIPGWLDTLGEMELLNSIAGFHYNHPAFIFPQPVQGRLSIEAVGMGHPLMKEEAAVVNDLSIGTSSQLHIITGSNMSGKSTYLRAVGLNMVLAQMGAPVFARQFEFTPVQFLTSFHHIDSLSESTSYFYAELRALQAIIQSLESPVPSLVLLDEVMRGTNSRDKHDGTALLIKKILCYQSLTLIATHDTELGILAAENPGSVENFCFESELTTDGLHFDFKKKNGVAQSTNATYLMKKMGII